MSLSLIEEHLKESARVKEALVSQAERIHSISTKLADCIRAGGRIYTCGNGGSACDAMHFVEELVARYQRERPGIAAQHLLDPGTLTCWANDYDYSSVFARQVQTLMKANDGLVVFSTSGNSENVLQALATANKIPSYCVGLLGKTGGKAKSLCSDAVIVESDVTAHIQEAHTALIHILCECLETELFPEAT